MLNQLFNEKWKQGLISKLIQKLTWEYYYYNKSPQPEIDIKPPLICANPNHIHIYIYKRSPTRQKKAPVLYIISSNDVILCVCILFFWVYRGCSYDQEIQIYANLPWPRLLFSRTQIVRTAVANCAATLWWNRQARWTNISLGELWCVFYISANWAAQQLILPSAAALATTTSAHKTLATFFFISRGESNELLFCFVGPSLSLSLQCVSCFSLSCALL